jgi:deoxycytidylate deaminase
MQYKYNTITGRKAPQHNLHAEIHALVKAKDYNDLQNCEIFIARYDRKGRMAMCRPCVACRRALVEKGITRITYTTPKGIQSEQL